MSRQILKDEKIDTNIGISNATKKWLVSLKYDKDESWNSVLKRLRRICEIKKIRQGTLLE